MKNGGYRAGAGRKPKATELELIELLKPLETIAFEALEKGVKAGEFAYVKLFFDYRYGKPRQRIELIDDQPIVINWVETKSYTLPKPDNNNGVTT